MRFYPTNKTAYVWLVETVMGHDSNECLIWPGAKIQRPKGYGQGVVRTPEGKVVYVHRLAFSIVHGRWPKHYARLNCNQPACFNPAHVVEIEKPQYEWLVEAIQNHHSDACLLWPFRRAKGYGQLTHEGEVLSVHRLAFKLTHGRWPEPCALHSCDNKKCFNPRHISEGTRAQNGAEASARGIVCRGERSPGAKLTDDKVRRIRQEFVMGTSLSTLAKRYGASRTTIQKAAVGQIWKHVK